jgi:hypothetical protein
MNERGMKDLAMMLGDNWPCRTLCLKKYSEDAHQMDFADLMRREEGKFIFIPLDVGQPETGDKTMLERLVNEGWLVD